MVPPLEHTSPAKTKWQFGAGGAYCFCQGWMAEGAVGLVCGETLHSAKVVLIYANGGPNSPISQRSREMKCLRIPLPRFSSRLTHGNHPHVNDPRRSCHQKE